MPESNGDGMMMNIGKRFVTFGLSATIAFAGVVAGPALGASAITLACPSGSTNSGTYSNFLSNGTLRTNFCIQAGYQIVRVNWEYQKTAGGGISLTPGWEIVNSTGTVNGGSWWNPAINATAGHTYTSTFTYGGSFPPSVNSTTPCMRGKLKDNIANVTFFTKIFCRQG